MNNTTYVPNNTQEGKKVCTICGETKSQNDFYLDGHDKNRRRSMCKECISHQGKTYYENHREKVCIRTSKHDFENDKVLARHREYHKRNKAWLNIKSMERIKKLRKDPNKSQVYKAYLRVCYAVKTGKLKKLPCEVCGAIPTFAHHYNGYSKEHALDVKWLCRKHHIDQHRRYQWNKNI